MNITKVFIIGILITFTTIFTACGGESDTTTTNSNSIQTTNNVLQAAKLVSLSSTSNDSIQAEWLPSESEENDSINYELHLSTQSGFTPSATTKKIETQDKEAIVNGLQASTLYYGILVTKNSSSKSANSIQLQVKTASIEPKLVSNITVVEQKQSSIVSLSESNVTSSSKVEEGEYIVNDESETPYLRKVVSVQKSANEYIAQTEPAGLGEVFTNIEFSTSYNLEETADVSKASKTLNRAGARTIKKSTYLWKSGSKLSSSHYVQSTKKLASSMASTLKIDDKGSNYTASISSAFSVGIGNKLSYKLDITQEKANLGTDNFGLDEKSECEAVGGVHEVETFGFNNCLDIPVKICSVSADTTIKSDVTTNNLPTIVEKDGDYYLEWTPASENIDSDGIGSYYTDVIIKSGVGNCEDDFEDAVETLSLNSIKVIAGDYLPSTINLVDPDDNVVLFDEDGVTITNELTATFTPSIILDGKFVNNDLEYGNAKLKTTFTVADLAKLHAELQTNKVFTPKPLFTKRFTKIVMAGAVPVVFVGQLKFMAAAEVEAKAELEATLDTGMTLDLEFGLEYKDGEWKPVTDEEFTYHIKAEAKGDAEATIKLKLIPDLSITIYELAAVHMLAEPYLYGTIGVDGEVSAQIANSDNTYTDSNARFTKLEAGAGMDLKLYAGAAWKTRFESLKFPSDANYTQIGGASFMNPKHKTILEKYYQDTDSYYKIEAIKQTPLTGIPTLTQDNPYYNEVPSQEIDSRAVKVVVGYENILNPLYPTLVKKEHYIKFDKWNDVEVISSNAQVIKTNTEGEYWVVPEVGDDGSVNNVDLRFSGYSTLGTWARQSIDMTLEVSTNSEEIPNYWAGRYVQSGDILSPNADDDNDGFSNLTEFKQGTNPISANEVPVNNNLEDEVKDLADITAPIFTSSTTVSVNENQISVLTLTATEETSTVTYAISETDFESFTIDKTTGLVTFVNAPDYETKSSYSFTATATDEAKNIATQTVTVTIVDVDEIVSDTTAPIFTSSVTVSVKENQTSALTLIATEETSTVTYSISGTDNTSFKLDETTGVVTFVNAPDYETKSSYIFIASATDEAKNIATQSITIDILDVDESSSDIVIKKTGQTTSYADYDDGYYQTGTTPSYTRASDIVTDHVTNLMWQDDESSITNTYTFDEATTSCQNLSLGGYTDWRVPTRSELVGIVDYGRHAPAINPVFLNTFSSYYWSSTSSAHITSNAWTVYFYYGSQHPDSKTGDTYVRCVRAGQ